MTDPIDICVLTFNRKKLTEKCLIFLNNRTKYPYRLFVVDNASTDGTDELLRVYEKRGIIFHWVRMSKNIGVHMGWNVALSFVSSEFFITSDNDLYVPELEPCWLEQLEKLMRDNLEYGAIALQPHLFLGRADPEKTGSDILEVGHCGAVFRMMRTEAVRKAGGWDYEFNATRNHEETTICSRLRNLGYKVGYAANLKAYHDFGEDNNWGYADIPPHNHGHRIPGEEIWPTPEKLKEREKEFDELTWIKKP